MRTKYAILIISLSLVTIASAQDYFPLREGNQWIYAVSNGAQVTTTVAGFTEINGVKCAIVESAAQNDYMTVDTEGVKVYMTESGGLEFFHFFLKQDIIAPRQ